MSIQEIIQLITSNGFAIVVAIWSLKYTFDTSSKKQEDINSQLIKLTDAINSNSMTLNKLVEKISVEE